MASIEKEKIPLLAVDSSQLYLERIKKDTLREFDSALFSISKRREQTVDN